MIRSPPETKPKINLTTVTARGLRPEVILSVKPYLAQASQASICRHGRVAYCGHSRTPGKRLPFPKWWPFKQCATNIPTAAQIPTDGMWSRVIATRPASDTAFCTAI
jgi:hypothetical protein